MCNKASSGDTAIRCRFGKKKSKSGLMNLLEKKKARQGKSKREKKRGKEVKRGKERKREDMDTGTSAAPDSH